MGFFNCVDTHYSDPLFKKRKLTYILDEQHCGVMVSVHISSAIDRGSPGCVKPNTIYTFCLCCFSDKHSALRSKRKDWFARNQNNVSE